VDIVTENEDAAAGEGIRTLDPNLGKVVIQRPLEWLPFHETPEIPDEQIDHIGIDLRKPALLRPAFIGSACSSAMGFLALPTSQQGRPIGIDAQNFLSFG